MGRRLFRWAICALPFALVPQAFGIVLMPGDPGVPVDSRPDDAVIGRWGRNGSAVAIKPNHILTAAHCGGGAGTIVEFGGVSYQVAVAIPVGLADLRVCRITRLDGADANLTQYTDIYRENDEINQTVVIGGFGQGRGQPFFDSTGRGFQWDGSDNTKLRWGCNRIEQIVENRRIRNCLNDMAIAFFDAPSYTRHIEHEAGLAMFDSGCGWFLRTETGWKVAAVGVGTQHPDRSVCSPPDGMAAVRLSQYAGRIDRICQVETNSPPQLSQSGTLIAAFDPALPWLSGWGAITFVSIGIVVRRRRREV